MPHRETNPHFSRPPPLQHQHEGSPHFSTPIPPQHQHEGHQQPPIPVPLHQKRRQPPTLGPVPIQQDVSDHPHLAPRQKHRGQPPILAPVSDHPHFPLRPRHEDRVPLRTRNEDFPLQPEEEYHYQPQTLQVPRRGKSQNKARKEHPDQGVRPAKSRVIFQEPSTTASGSPDLPPQDYPPERWKQPNRDWRQGGIRLPEEEKSRPVTWIGACLCVIFWLIIIFGGLIVLIVYLVFRPQNPNFDVSGVTLNAAYIDYGYLLNADVTVLANFTNPNKKVHVDFSSVIIYLYYGSTLIASQYVEPFSAARAQSRFANIHMITSQVQLPQRESQRLLKQMESNGVLLEVKGVFRARSKLGSILRYSYNLYGRCSIMLTRPPDGIMLKKKCRTKR